MPTDPSTTHAYFSSLASTYAAHRPTYPALVIAAIVGDDARRRVVDVGCGTGVLTRMLAAHGCAVIGIDPSDGMLDEAHAHGPSTSLTYRCGTAEATGLPDASADLVTCAQAFHWFDAPRALAEFHRVLVPGGRLTLIWNVRRPDDPFAITYQEIVPLAQHDAAARGRVVPRQRTAQPDATGHFTGVHHMEFDNPHSLDWPSLLGRARSASYFPVEPDRRDELEAMLRRAFEEHQRDGRVVMEQRTEVTVATRVG